jgi:cyclic pyranopterin phosphate synthase
MPKKKGTFVQNLTHLDAKGRASMVDVSEKPSTARHACAACSVFMKKETLRLIADNAVAKGNVLETARLSGIMAAKKTGDLIPLCHPLSLSSVAVDFRTVTSQGRIDIRAEAKCTGPTGVEMEALTAASVAALTIYDMCKAVDRGMTISDIRLLEKGGGRSGTWKRP